MALYRGHGYKILIRINNVFFFYTDLVSQFHHSILGSLKIELFFFLALYKDKLASRLGWKTRIGSELLHHFI